jgi:hypothetical protein
MNRFTSFLLVLVVLVILPASAINAQVATATIYASIEDPSGSPVVGATVTLVHELTSATRTATTNDEGEVSLSFLSVGRYRVTIVSRGFKEQTQTGIDLGAGQRLRLNYRLEVGEVTERVTITSEAPLINAVNAEQQIAHSLQEVRELPLQRRDWTSLLNVGTGMRVRESGGGTGVSMNGLPPGGLSLTVDGTQASSSSEETSLSQFGNFNLIKIVSLEAISEINVSKGILSAEHANTLSGNIGLITKSGGNEFHGSLFENYLGKVLNARNQFLTTRPPEVFNQFGGSFGGPIIKNKLFIFGVYEGYRQRRFATLSGNVPTLELRTPAIAAVPAYKAFFDTLPLPNQPYVPGATVARYIGFGSNAANDDHLVFRGDYNINDLNRVTGRYTRGRPDSETPRVSAQNTRTFVGLDDVATASYFHTTSNYSAETRFGFTRNNVERLDAMYETGIPNINVLGFDNGGETIQSRGKGFSIEQIIAINRGRHSLKIGGLFQRQNQTRFNVGAPVFAYGSQADLNANDPTSATFSFGIDPYLITYWTNGYFVQDDFKIRHNLVLNLGLRYDYFSVPREEDGRLFNREEPFGLGVLRSPDSIYNADRNNFAPRVGFAWTVDKSAKTVVRSGFGMYYTRAPLRNTIELVRNAVDEPFRTAFSRQEARALGIKYPLTNDAVLPLVKNPNAPWTGTTINPDFPTPYSMQWILSVQRQLTSTISLDTAYVGTRGVHLVLNRVVNQVNRQTGLRPYAGFGEFRHFDTSDSTSYHAWQTSVQKRLSNNLLFNFHYTWSRTICYQIGDLSSLNLPQDLNNISAERGPSAFDIPHRFTADFLYSLPFQRWWSADSLGKRLLLNGWQVGGIYIAESGPPLDIAMPNALGGQRVDAVSGQNVYLEKNSALLYLNRAAFATVPVIAASGASARPGTLGRNALRGPGFWNIDLSLSKSLQFTERIALQIRADMFNAFNHTSFSGINTTITSGTFGAFTSTRGARTVQLNARLTF